MQAAAVANTVVIILVIALLSYLVYWLSKRKRRD